MYSVVIQQNSIFRSVFKGAFAIDSPARMFSICVEGGMTVPVRVVSPKKMTLILFFLLSVLCSVATAEDTRRSFTFNTEHPAGLQTLPQWMTGQPEVSPSVHATISFPITPPADQSDLAVTVYFTESIGAFLRAYWAGSQTNEMLSDDLFEGIAMPNQRTILIKRSTLSSSGTLTLQSSETTLDVSRVHFEWVDPSTISLASRVKQSALIDGAGKVFKELDVNGVPPQPPTDQVGSSVVTASLTDKPVRIESGVEFLATLQTMPQYSRLEIQISGAALGNTVQLTLNGNLVGNVSVDVPDLNDPGYQINDGAPPVYVGWRKGVIYVPAAQLKVGENQFQIGLKDVIPSGTASPLAVKDLLLQLKYPEQPPAAQPASQEQTQTALPVPVASGT